MLRDPGVMRGDDYQSGVQSVNVWNDYLTQSRDVRAFCKRSLP